MPEFNPETDLQTERLIHAKPEIIWRCWAEPELFKVWFTPPGVDVVSCENVLEPGGRAFNVMRLPDGNEMPNDGSFIHVELHRRLVYTDGLLAGFRPQPTIFMVVDLTLTPKDGGTLYHAHIMHATAEARDQHEAMGFEDGWGTTLAQLDALAATL